MLSPWVLTMTGNGFTTQRIRSAIRRRFSVEAERSSFLSADQLMIQVSYPMTQISFVQLQFAHGKNAHKKDASAFIPSAFVFNKAKKGYHS
jgi:hypothetical protein